MNRDIHFYKMHGAGNDFVLVDDRAAGFPSADHELVRAICARRTGVGSDGLILLQPSRTASFRMVFFNPDGRQADMCGNGARCAARLAHELGVAPATMKIETGAGMLRAEIGADGVLLHMTPPRDWNPHRTFEAARSWGFVDVFRKHRPEPGHYTFFDCRQVMALKKNQGWRIDHMLATPPLAATCTRSWIDLEPRMTSPCSDHTFLAAEFAV